MAHQIPYPGKIGVSMAAEGGIYKEKPARRLAGIGERRRKVRFTLLGVQRTFEAFSVLRRRCFHDPQEYLAHIVCITEATL